MLHICWFCLCLWHLVGVFGESVSVTEGDPVTLHTGLHKRMDDDVIQWMFGYKSIAKICIANGRITVNYVLNGRFRDRLKLDNQTGSLTITNTRPEHTGVYELQTNCLRKSFILTVQRCSSCIIGDVDDISVVEGYQFTLAPSHTEMIVNNVIQWRFVPPNALLAEINKQTNRIAVYDDVLDGRFRDRLKLDNQTGSLTITNITTEHTGVFEVQNNNLHCLFLSSAQTVQHHHQDLIPIPSATRLNIWTSASSVTRVQTLSTVVVILNL
ncbi:uncharacterized protein LOC131530823 isoform X4 [Onychostoma macrolepis]|uniref:uncharacterized protein LOC131530823 isoform X4 n=1 Tax=Onychostoma macrolepis TaxID=369639 RepID=UPI00272B9155|nr:uncharacterized protein LOC131530823 isoform X4 [Onychostoma macrolepis]